MSATSVPFAAIGDPTQILNWRRLDDRLTTSGQPTEDQLSMIGAMDVGLIINLGLHSHAKALADESATVSGLGMDYIHIPVDFAAPSEADLTLFQAALAQNPGRRIHLHCIYNARVSAFLYRHTTNQGAHHARAAAIMDSIWRPGGVWARFIGKYDEEALPDRYAGRDY